ncbi:MAG TPA: hypothetical protein VFX96_11850, partial [Pyrinomonadaceae bacterium]|nr:hypothetical protein [Pyrinomonadaceae bacterium]
MKLRTKLIAVYVALAAVPLVVLSALGYATGTSAVETLLRDDAVRRAARSARGVERGLASHEARLSTLAARVAMRERILLERTGQGPSAEVLEDVRDDVAKFFAAGEGGVESLTCLDSSGRPLFRAERGGGPNDAPRVRDSDIAASQVKFDNSALALEESRVLRSHVAAEPYGAGVRSTVPVFAREGDAGARPVGALVAEARVAHFFARAEDAGAPDSLEERFTAALDAEGRVVYHTNEGMRNQPVEAAMPGFASVARGRAGAGE